MSDRHEREEQERRERHHHERGPVREQRPDFPTRGGTYRAIDTSDKFPAGSIQNPWMGPGTSKSDVSGTDGNVQVVTPSGDNQSVQLYQDADGWHVQRTTDPVDVS